MEKLKWCLLCSAAELLNERMENFLFFFSCLYFLYEACECRLWIKAKSLNSTGCQQKSKAVDNKLRITERKKNCPDFHGVALKCLAGACRFCFATEGFESRSQRLSRSLRADHVTAPCMHSPCVCNNHHTSQLHSFSHFCSASNHWRMVRKCTKKTSKIIYIYLLFSIVHLLHGFHIHAVLSGESFALCYKSIHPRAAFFSLHSLAPVYINYFNGISSSFSIPIE